MNKMCDRCRVGGCLLTYLGKGCENARKEACPDVRPNRAELISSMDMDQMVHLFPKVLRELCQPGVPPDEFIMAWLYGEPSRDETLSGLLP